MIRWLAAGLMLVCLPVTAAPAFSPAHEKMLTYFEARSQAGIYKALWLRHNALLLSVDTTRQDAKDLAKAACARLLANGFNRMQASVTVVEHSVLLRENRFKEAAHRACD